MRGGGGGGGAGAGAGAGAQLAASTQTSTTLRTVVQHSLGPWPALGAGQFLPLDIVDFSFCRLCIR